MYEHRNFSLLITDMVKVVNVACCTVDCIQQAMHIQNDDPYLSILAPSLRGYRAIRRNRATLHTEKTT